MKYSLFIFSQDHLMRKGFTLSEHNYEPIFIARQPIYDRDNTVWGYELLFRHNGDASIACMEDHDVATSTVIADGFSLALAGLDKDLKVLISFTAKLLGKDAALALPATRCVLEIVEPVEPTPEMLSTLRRLKAKGYLLALDDFVGIPWHESLVKLADIIKVEVLDMDANDLSRVTSELRKRGCRLLAEKVETGSKLEACRRLGYGLFQGFFFNRPEIVPGRKISAALLAKARLLGALTRPDIEMNALAELIGQDVALSYRLLKFINCSAFGFKTTIKSLSQAVALLGMDPFRQWAMVVIIADMDLSPKGAELALLSLQRAHFLQNMCVHAHDAGHSPDTMFLLGLFSKLDALLGQDMAETLQHMDLDPEIARALCGESNTAGQWLELLQAVESGKWDDVDVSLQAKGLDAAVSAKKYLEASAWAATVMGQAKNV